MRLTTFIHYDAVVSTDAGLWRLLDRVKSHGLALIGEVPVSAAATRALLERVGPLFPSLFGDFWEFSNDASYVDLAYTNKAIALHTDGTYYPEPPRLEVFHCLRFEGEGGHSVLSDGVAAAERLRTSDRAVFDLLREVRVPARYLDGELDSRGEHPVLTLEDGSDGTVRRVCFNPYDRQPFDLEVERRAAFEAAWRAYAQEVARPGATHRLPLQPGTALMFDNWRMLHAREAFTGERHLCGAYVSHEVFERSLAAAMGP